MSASVIEEDVIKVEADGAHASNRQAGDAVQDAEMAVDEVDPEVKPRVESSIKKESKTGLVSETSNPVSEGAMQIESDSVRNDVAAGTQEVPAEPTVDIKEQPMEEDAQTSTGDADQSSDSVLDDKDVRDELSRAVLGDTGSSDVSTKSISAPEGSDGSGSGAGGGQSSPSEASDARAKVKKEGPGAEAALIQKASDANEEGAIRCVCDHPTSDDGDLLVQCDWCGYWFHAGCFGLSSRNLPKFFYCSRCFSKLVCSVCEGENSDPQYVACRTCGHPVHAKCAFRVTKKRVYCETCKPSTASGKKRAQARVLVERTFAEHGPPTFDFIRVKDLREMLRKDYGFVYESFSGPQSASHPFTLSRNPEPGQWAAFEHALLEKYAQWYLSAGYTQPGAVDPAHAKTEVVCGLSAILQAPSSLLARHLSLAVDKFAAVASGRLADPFAGWSVVENNTYSSNALTLIEENREKMKNGDVDMEAQVELGAPRDVKVERVSLSRFGLVAGEDIPSGVFVVEYMGHVISSQEADAVSLPFLICPGSRPGDSAGVFCVDARFGGSIGRFVQRSCLPNSEIRRIAYKTPRFGLFSTMKIEKGSRLSIAFDTLSVDLDCIAPALACICENRRKRWPQRPRRPPPADLSVPPSVYPVLTSFVPPPRPTEIVSGPATGMSVAPPQSAPVPTPVTVATTGNDPPPIVDEGRAKNELVDSPVRASKAKSQPPAPTSDTSAPATPLGREERKLQALMQRFEELERKEKKKGDVPTKEREPREPRPQTVKTPKTARSKGSKSHPTSPMLYDEDKFNEMFGKRAREEDSRLVKRRRTLGPPYSPRHLSIPSSPPIVFGKKRWAKEVVDPTSPELSREFSRSPRKVSIPEGISISGPYLTSTSAKTGSRGVSDPFPRLGTPRPPDEGALRDAFAAARGSLASTRPLHVVTPVAPASSAEQLADEKKPVSSPLGLPARAVPIPPRVSGPLPPSPIQPPRHGQSRWGPASVPLPDNRRGSSPSWTPPPRSRGYSPRLDDRWQPPRPSQPSQQHALHSSRGSEWHPPPPSQQQRPPFSGGQQQRRDDWQPSWNRR